MQDKEARFQRTAGILAILAAPIALTSFFLGPAAYGWDFDVMFDPVRAIAHRGVDLSLVRAGWMLDVAGYYFLLLPLLIVLHARARSISGHARSLASICGIGYMLTGSLGAVMLAATTGLFERHASVDPSVVAATREIYVNLFHLVLDGVWNLLTMSLFAAWALIMGVALWRDSRVVGGGSVVLGVLSALDVSGYALRVEALSTLGLFGYLFGFPLWCVLTGVWCARRRE